MTQLKNMARVELSELGADAGAKGIAHIAFEKYFDSLISSIETHV